MTFRVRKGFLSGSAILQMSDESNWVDVDPGDLPSRFCIVTGYYIEALHADLAAYEKKLRVQAARIALYERRALAARKGRAKKKPPVLTDEIVNPPKREANPLRNTWGNA